MKALASIATAAALALALSAPASAIPLTYDEAVDGDLPDSNPPVLQFMKGLNTVSGNLGFNGITDFDEFSFTFAAGLTLVSATADFVQTSGNLTIASWNFLPTNEFVSINIPTGGAIGILGGSLPLAGGAVYTFDAVSMGASGPGDRRADYTFSFLVVSEPATLLLLGVALTGLGLARKRRG